MALINRITRLFRADMHAVLDRIEEPASLLRQAVREMEEDIAQHEQRLKLLDNELHRLGKHQHDIAQALTQLDAELNVCFEAGKDDLARTLIRRKLEAQRLHQQLVRKRNSVQDQLAESGKQLQEHRSRYEAMRQKRDLLANEEPGVGDAEFDLQTGFHVSEADVEVALLREKQQRRPS